MRKCVVVKDFSFYCAVFCVPFLPTETVSASSMMREHGINRELRFPHTYCI